MPSRIHEVHVVCQAISARLWKTIRTKITQKLLTLLIAVKGLLFAALYENTDINEM